MLFAELFALLTVSAGFPTMAALYLNDWESSAVKSLLLFETSSLLNYHKLPDVSEELSLYLVKLYIGIAM